MTRRVCAGSFFISGVVMAGEHVILLDEQDKPTGMLEKYAAHTSTPLHLAFSSWLFNEQGQLLVTRRSLGKKPGQAYGRTQSAGIRKPAKPLNRPLSAAAALSSALRLPASSRSSGVPIGPLRRMALSKTRSVRSMRHESPARYG
jgi:hypothetical protein